MKDTDLKIDIYLWGKQLAFDLFDLHVHVLFKLDWVSYLLCKQP